MSFQTNVSPAAPSGMLLGQRLGQRRRIARQFKLHKPERPRFGGSLHVSYLLPLLHRASTPDLAVGDEYDGGDVERQMVVQVGTELDVKTGSTHDREPIRRPQASGDQPPHQDQAEQQNTRNVVGNDRAAPGGENQAGDAYAQHGAAQQERANRGMAENTIVRAHRHFRQTQ